VEYHEGVQVQVLGRNAVPKACVKKKPTAWASMRPSGIMWAQAVFCI